MLQGLEERLDMVIVPGVDAHGPQALIGAELSDRPVPPLHAEALSLLRQPSRVTIAQGTHARPAEAQVRLDVGHAVVPERPTNPTSIMGLVLARVWRFKSFSGQSKSLRY
ncbi:MAG: hypothetical protein NTU62_01270 [Spirochaetes bacterium]|nr:hypothetical protein [Spirochaetota bacterium]